MPKPGKGLYAPRLVDFTFVVMGLGSAVLLARADQLAMPNIPAASDPSLNGVYLLVSVVLIAASACLMHNVDRKGWDDYMGQVVSQSALIAIITLLLVGVAFDFLLTPWLGVSVPKMMIQGMVPVACCSWAIGYGFLRWRGTSA